MRRRIESYNKEQKPIFDGKLYTGGTNNFIATSNNIIDWLNLGVNWGTTSNFRVLNERLYICTTLGLYAINNDLTSTGRLSSYSNSKDIIYNSYIDKYIQIAGSNILYSTDGLSFTIATNVGTSTKISINIVGSTLYIIDSVSNIWTSGDGITWNSSSKIGGASGTPLNALYKDGFWLISYNYGIARGQALSNMQIVTGTSGSWTKIKEVGDYIVFCCNNQNQYAYAKTSGSQITIVQESAFNNYYCTDVTYKNNKYVFSLNNGYVAYKDNIEVNNSANTSYVGGSTLYSII